MKITYLTNAAFSIELSSGQRWSTDPWLNPGAFYGAWWHYPQLPAGASDLLLGEANYVYVSHLHPDHLDPAALADIPASIPVLIGRLGHDHLRRAIAKARSQDPIEVDLNVTHTIEGTEVAVLGPFGRMSDGLVDEVGYEMDTSLVLRDPDGSLIFHIVDNPIRVEDAEDLVRIYGRPTVAILPYSGASAYPHAFSYSDSEKERRARQLQNAMLARFFAVARVLDADLTIPAAGSYVMGGRIAAQTKWLHQATPDALRTGWEEAGLDPRRLAVMAPGDQIDVGDDAHAASGPGFTVADRLSYALGLVSEPLAQDLISVPDAFAIPWPRLLEQACRRLRERQVQFGVFPELEIRLVLLPSSGVSQGFSYRFSLAPDGETPMGWIEFRLDASLMLMLLMGAAIWNNAENGGLIAIDREPDRYSATAHNLMSYFSLL